MVGFMTSNATLVLEVLVVSIKNLVMKGQWQPHKHAELYSPPKTIMSFFQARPTRNRPGDEGTLENIMEATSQKSYSHLGKKIGTVHSADSVGLSEMKVKLTPRNTH